MAQTAQKTTPETIGEALPPIQAAQAERTVRDEGNEWPRIGDRVLIKANIQGPAAWKRTVCGKEGIVEKVEGGYFSVRIAEGKKGLVEKLVWNEVDAVAAPAPASGIVVGARVRVKDDARGVNGRLRKCCGREGDVETVTGETPDEIRISVRFGPNLIPTTNLTPNEVELVSPTTQVARADEGSGIEMNEKQSQATPVWPFPVNGFENRDVKVAK